MGKDSSKKRGGGEQRFHEFFSEVYGDRWDSLKKSLMEKSLKVARRNFFFKDTQKLKTFYGSSDSGLLEPLDLGDPRVQCHGVGDIFSYEKFQETLWPFYRMDPASLFVPLALNVEPGDNVLDMCAAPGGKSLPLVEAIETSGTITLNEYSAKRKYRLMSVVKNYVSPEVRSRIHITGKDGAQFRLTPDTFDKVMIDAPCSGERELFHKPLDMDLWKPSRTKRFGLKQYSLLAAGITALKPGGTLVYSTCSLSPFENDGVVSKLLKRRGEEVEVLPLKYIEGEATEHGWHFLPDNSGWGPIYMSLIRKNM